MALVCQAFGQPIPTQVSLDEGRARFERNGEVFFAQGAAGRGPLGPLAAAGANVTRTWRVTDKTGAFLDEAHANGLAVIFGIRFPRADGRFDYTSAKQRQEHLAHVRRVVTKHRDHPALLAWGLGNEMELGAGDATPVWRHVEAAASLVTSLDPHHPTMTVVAEIGGTKVRDIHAFCPSIDVVGINAYGGAASLPERYARAGGVKPFLVTEFGTQTPYEARRTSWGMPLEHTSTTKAKQYERSFRSLLDAPNCLGAIAFTWGGKRQGTITWHGMLLEDGSKLAAVDSLTELWGGSINNRCPRIEAFETADALQLAPGASFTASIKASDPDGDALSFEYRLLAELPNALGGGNSSPPPRDFSEAVVSSKDDSVTIVTPPVEAPLRLYAIVRDGRSSGAAASIPILVARDIEIAAHQPTEIDEYVVFDGVTENRPWKPSGWMGRREDISIHAIDDAQGEGKCLRVSFDSPSGWGGVVWQTPEGNWGSRPGGIDLEGVGFLRFRSRGERGGERVRFGYGLSNDPTKQHPDSSRAEMDITLTDDWLDYEIPVGDRDMSHIVSGFFWIVRGQSKPLTWYLADIRFESSPPQISESHR